MNTEELLFRHPPSKLRLFLALSRTPHGLLDMATPLLAALLFLGRMPSPRVAFLGLVAAAGGYTAVYALNDIVDHRVDREKLAASDPDRENGYLDAALVRHPIAAGLLGLGEAVAWAGAWALVSLAAAWLLNPVSALILILGCLLEIIYCKLLTVTRLRVLVSGVVKTLGGLAAIFAVDPHPSPWLTLGLFAWIFAWEIGGQNIPADWHDADADAESGARTLTVSLGKARAANLAVACLGLGLLLSVPVLGATPGGLSWPFLTAALALGFALTLAPALRLRAEADSPGASARLFNLASLYPLATLAVVVLHMALG